MSKNKTKNKEFKAWLTLKENEMLEETVKINGVVIDDHNFKRARGSRVLDGFVCKRCKLGVGYAIGYSEDDEDNGAPCVMYPF